MKILFTGGGSGGHFYPIISIAEAFNELVKEKKIIGTELYFMAPNPYEPGILYEHGIEYKQNSAGKVRRNPGLLSIFRNFFDLFKTGWGVVTAVLTIYRIYPDVVVGKGAYGSFPALLAAKILRIPVVIHESDTVPGKVNLWAGKFAARVAVSFREAAKYFPEGRVAYTGLPIRRDIAVPITEGAFDFLELEKDVPVVLVLTGSQGAQVINDTILEGLKNFVEHFQIIHQTGKKNVEECRATADAVLHGSAHKNRYKVFDYLNPLALRMAAGAATVVVSRAGSTIFEIAAWQTPAIVIPITLSNGDHQRQNAFAYARAGACTVIEESNLRPNILLSEITRLASSPEEREKMKAGAKSFFKPDAAHLVAEEILKIALEHEIK
jgi:UDP-N-acetylglucosamine--N-acetylmuramyl-(pentapeptide) pyrophosphoryl-undecaprenol N-acetylglucosamine transferase